MEAVSRSFLGLLASVVIERDQPVLDALGVQLAIELLARTESLLAANQLLQILQPLSERLDCLQFLGQISRLADGLFLLEAHVPVESFPHRYGVQINRVSRTEFVLGLALLSLENRQSFLDRLAVGKVKPVVVVLVLDVVARRLLEDLTALEDVDFDDGQSVEAAVAAALAESAAEFRVFWKIVSDTIDEAAIRVTLESVFLGFGRARGSRRRRVVFLLAAAVVVVVGRDVFVETVVEALLFQGRRGEGRRLGRRDVGTCRIGRGGRAAVVVPVVAVLVARVVHVRVVLVDFTVPVALQG